MSEDFRRIRGLTLGFGNSKETLKQFFFLNLCNVLLKIENYDSLNKILQ